MRTQAWSSLLLLLACFAAPAAQQATGPSTTPQSCDSSDQPASSSSDRGLPTNTADSPEPSSLSLLTCDVLRQTYKFSPQCGDRAVGDEPSSFSSDDFSSDEARQGSGAAGGSTARDVLVWPLLITGVGGSGTEVKPRRVAN